MSFAGCSTVPTATGCSTLAESVLTTRTPHPQIGNSGEEDLDWQLLGASYAGALNTANDRAETGFKIIRGCEMRDEEIKSARSWWPF